MPEKNFLKRIIQPFGNPTRFIRAFPRYLDFFRDIIKYSSLNYSEKIKIRNLFPVLHDKYQKSFFDPDYSYQNIWAFEKIKKSKVESHLDIGSKIDYLGFLTTITKVIFIDIRPLSTDFENFNFVKGDITSLNLKDNSVKSLSCLSVAEHIGLGRYGDRLDPKGTEKACKELQRVLAKEGNLYFSLPIGKPRVLFNAHRVHSLQQILHYFKDLKLVEFSYVDNSGRFIKKAEISEINTERDINGLFHFKKLK